MSSFELRIERMSYGQGGVGRHEGQVIFVPYAAPGDLLQVTISEKHKNFSIAEIDQILEAGRSRVKAPCPVFGKCGGCQWQHLSYQEQLAQKQQIVETAFSKAKLKVEKFEKIASSPRDFNYRNRIQLHWQQGKLGYFARKSHDLVPIETCPIAENEINHYLPELRKQLSNRKDDIRFEVALNAEFQPMMSESATQAESHAFSQVNRFQNEAMISEALAVSKAHMPERIFDLYAGSGNFTFPLSQQHPRATVIAAELSEKSVAKAKEVCVARNISPKGLQFYVADVAAFLKRQRLQPKDFVLLDPPRVGCDEAVMHNLGTQDFRKMVYISCNPMTLVRDLSRLTATNSHWIIERVKPFDMFPQTDHIEVFVELRIDS